jgi:hypothetical protein
MPVSDDIASEAPREKETTPRLNTCIYRNGFLIMKDIGRPFMCRRCTRDNEGA